ncbi:MAG: hypothetical protein ACI83O_000419 [Patescibacteria group bacterium]|jgi:hypothetical protein
MSEGELQSIFLYDATILPWEGNEDNLIKFSNGQTKIEKYIGHERFEKQIGKDYIVEAAASLYSAKIAKLQSSTKSMGEERLMEDPLSMILFQGDIAIYHQGDEQGISGFHRIGGGNIYYALDQEIAYMPDKTPFNRVITGKSKDQKEFVERLQGIILGYEQLGKIQQLVSDPHYQEAMQETEGSIVGPRKSFRKY